MWLSISKGVFLFGVFILLTAVFNSNFFGRLDDPHKNFQRDSESLIIGRLALSEREGVFSQSGLPGWYESFLVDQYVIYLDGGFADKDLYNTYNSQNGGQGMLFSVLDKLSPYSKESNLKGFYMLTAALLAAFMTAFLYWVRTNFGILAVLTTLLLILWSDWIVIFGKNLWWSLWSFYLPFIFFLLLLNREVRRFKKQVIQSKAFFLGAFAVLFIKCFITGYEYITTTLLMAITPLVYYGIQERWSIRVLVTRTLWTSLGFLAALVSSVLLLIFQLSGKKNLEAANGVDYLIQTFLRRTHASSDRFSEAYTESLEATVTVVLDKYLAGEAFVFKMTNGVFTVAFKEVIFVFMAFTLVFIGLKWTQSLSEQQWRRGLALAIAMWFSILAPLSWLVIFKSHSYIHIHMNFIVWYMPFMLLGFVWIGYVLSCACSGLFKRSSIAIRYWNGG
ncbi:hypothetical protein [Flavobacterium sp. JP2137]|uniref:hypothetical protein n=1 Tax=Flavobacterium sp. JP2137 TaxID=3414510 RepID=UPI003D2FC159